MRYIAWVMLVAIGCVGSPYPPPPETPEHLVVDTLHGVEFRDPYRWLEDQDGPNTRAWIDAQNAYAETIVGQNEQRTAVRERLQQLMDTDDVGSPTRRGSYEYFTLRPAGRELPIIYRRPAPPEGTIERIDPAAQYEVVLDPHSMNPQYTTRLAIQSISSDGATMVYSVRDGGQDEVELRLRDLKSGTDLPERFSNALYSSIAFDEQGAGFYYVHRSRRDGPRVRYHQVGTPIDDDREIFGAGIGPTSFISVNQIEEGRRLILGVQHGWARGDVFVLDTRDGSITTIAEGLDGRFDTQFIDGTLYMRTDLDAPKNHIVAVDLTRPEREHWQVVIPEGNDVMQSFSLIDEAFYVTYLHNVSTRIEVFGRDGQSTGEVPVPEFHAASIRRASKGKAFLQMSSFTTPSVTYLLDLDTGDREIWETAQVPFDGTPYTVKQVWYASKDGTEIPMFIVHHSDLELTGEHPTLLYGYGGFTVSLLPRFSTTAALWLEHGGVYAMPNLRGGTEFGEEWHRGGMLENKQNVFDDFIAAAEWLIDNGYTTPSRLAIRGGSNGGLLVASAFTQRPELFRAVFCGFPDLDMLRFYTFEETNNKPALLEYGNASLPDHFAFIKEYSPYQHVVDGVNYPAVILTSGDLDTRVPPLQARKMAARLQGATRSGLPIILSYDSKQGHAAGRGRPMSTAIDNTAMELTFLMSQLGVESPQLTASPAASSQ